MPLTTTGTLDLILGCMFSGKSTELINRIRKHRLIGRTVLVVNHARDVRYDAEGRSVVSHNNDRETAHISTDSLASVRGHSDYAGAHSIFIEEAQFFTGLRETVLAMVETDGKHVVVCGLDGDYLRNPFYEVVSLVPLADTVIRPTALCILCSDGTPAMFSMRRTQCRHQSESQSKSEEVILVGGADLYAPVCRMHYLQNTRDE